MHGLVSWYTLLIEVKRDPEGMLCGILLHFFGATQPPKRLLQQFERIERCSVCS
jgi:hypothetical protein